MKDNSLFPLYFKGQKYNEQDCHYLFLAVYHCRESLNVDCGVYLGDGMWVYPDGSINNF